jgi:serine/threonine protein kinase
MTLQAAQTSRPTRAKILPFRNTGPGRYQPLCELGRGGMGVVYKARDRRLDRIVAIKFLPQEWNDDDVARERFIHEARAASAIDHQNICTIHDIGSTKDGRLFIVMAHYDGETLKQRLERGELETPEIVDIATQIAHGLEAAHRRGIVHRDVKPGNIFLCASGVVKLLDFGLAAGSSATQGEDAWLDNLDTPGRPLGTASYMAPERILEMPVDVRSDIFSLGVVIYEMATKRRPFGGESVFETIIDVLETEPAPLATAAPAHPAGLEKVVSKCLAKHPDGRFQSASELVSALAEIDVTRQRLPVRGFRNVRELAHALRVEQQC